MDEKRYKVVIGSQTAHCCFDATVVDTSEPTGFGGQFNPVCECFEVKDAERICAALNGEQQP